MESDLEVERGRRLLLSSSRRSCPDVLFGLLLLWDREFLSGPRRWSRSRVHWRSRGVQGVPGPGRSRGILAWRRDCCREHFADFSVEVPLSRRFLEVCSAYSFGQELFRRSLHDAGALGLGRESRAAREVVSSSPARKQTTFSPFPGGDSLAAWAAVSLRGVGSRWSSVRRSSDAAFGGTVLRDELPEVLRGDGCCSSGVFLWLVSL